MNRLTAFVATALVVAAGIGCSTATSQQTYIEPTPETVTSTTEVRQTDPPEHLLVVSNRSTVPVTVFSVSLTSCVNVKQQCIPQQRSIRVAPGARQVVLRVTPRSPSQSFSYRFNYSWRVDESDRARMVP